MEDNSKTRHCRECNSELRQSYTFCPICGASVETVESADSTFTNPFAVLGIPANSTERQIQKQISSISAYSRVGKEFRSNYDFSLSRPADRTEESVRTAAGQIEQPLDRMRYALMWFIDINHIDSTALDYLRHDNYLKASEIWGLAIKDRPVTLKNYSAAQNLSTLQFILVLTGWKGESLNLATAIRIKGRVATSCFDELSLATVGENVSVSHLEVLKLYVDDVLAIARRLNFNISELIESFGEYPNETRSYVEDRLSEGPIQRITILIQTAEEAKRVNPKKANSIGLRLHRDCKADMKLLRSVLGPGKLRFQMLANDLADALLDCSITYFNEYVESQKVDPGKDALKLLNFARSIGPTGTVKHRIDANAPTIESWNENAAEREEMKRLKKQIDFILKELKAFGGGIPSARRAADLILECTPSLSELRDERADEAYVQLSEIVAAAALGMTIASINSAQEVCQRSVFGVYDLSSGSPLFRLKEEIRDAVRVMTLLGSMNMSADLRRRFEANRRSIFNISRDLGIPLQQAALSTPKKEAPSQSAQRQVTGTVPLMQFAKGRSDADGSWADRLSPRVVFGGVLLIGFGILIAASLVSPNPGGLQASVNRNTNAVPTRTFSASPTKSSTDTTPTPLPTATPKIERPSTGTLVSRGSGGRGYGTLEISNGTSFDAIAKLVNVSTGKSHREVYVRANSSARVSGIAQGTYELYFSTGNDFAPSLKKFLRSATYSKFDDSLNFQEIRESDGITFSNFRVSLDKVALGTATTSAVDENSFSNK